MEYHVPGAHDRRIRERYTNILAPSVKKGPFTPEEDELSASLSLAIPLLCVLMMFR